MYVHIFWGATMSDKPGHDARLAATRLAAVQAVYEIGMMNVPVDDVLASFAAERWTAADDEVSDEMARPRPELLKDIVRGVSSDLTDIDAAISQALGAERQLEDVEAVLLALLRTATHELKARPNVPARAVISAYVGIGDAFFDDDAPQSKLIAGVLNGLARSLRADEFARAG